jgi:hypothetical protein
VDFGKVARLLSGRRAVVSKPVLRTQSQMRWPRRHQSQNSQMSDQDIGQLGLGQLSAITILTKNKKLA